MTDEIANLLDWLTKERPMNKPFVTDSLKRFHRIACKGGNSAFCFVSKEDINIKTYGNIKKGDLLCPASWSSPAKHARGSLFDKDTWEKAFTEYGMKMLRG